MSITNKGSIAAGSERQHQLGSQYAPSMHLESQPHLSSQVSVLNQGKLAGLNRPNKQPKLCTEQELHKGWLENVRAEKRTVIK